MESREWAGNRFRRALFQGSPGFTFIEAITVGVIMAVLAAMAIPIYTRYVQNQKQDVVESLAQTAAVAANVYWRKTGLDPSLDANELDLFLPDPERYQVTIDEPNVVVRDLSEDDVQASVPYR